jgi:transcriptional regulator with XRE-family HTH domain
VAKLRLRIAVPPEVRLHVLHASTIVAGNGDSQGAGVAQESFSNTWYAMPKKPQINHPVRQVRTALGHTQPRFAKLVGCSTIAIQRIENGSLKLSPKLAYAIAEATHADPRSLLQGVDAIALDVGGEPYSKPSFERTKALLACLKNEPQHYLYELIRYLELLLIASNRTGKFKLQGSMPP